MANNYSDTTGVLVLTKVTPVISALFGPFKLDADYPGDGRAYIGKIDEDNVPSWGDILDGLGVLVETLVLKLPDGQEETIENFLNLLAWDFESDDEGFKDLIRDFDANHDLEDDAELDFLFDIAKYLDDGHGLSAMMLEGCWYCDKARLFEFGGYGDYHGANVSVTGNSSSILRLGESLDKALQSGNLEAGAKLIHEQVKNMVNVTNPEVREALTSKLAECFVASDDAAEPKLKYFAVTGRIPGNDEDVAHIFNVATREEALAEFSQSLYEGEENPDEARANTRETHGDDMYVTSSMVSDSPITNLY